MRKIISFMHISLDGFVAGPNGEMNYKKDGPVVLDNLKIQYSDLQKFYRDPAERSIDN